MQDEKLPVEEHFSVLVFGIYRALQAGYNGRFRIRRDNWRCRNHLFASSYRLIARIACCRESSGIDVNRRSVYHYFLYHFIIEHMHRLRWTVVWPGQREIATFTPADHGLTALVLSVPTRP